MSAAKAELSLAAAGVPVVPIQRGTKNPGSLLGRGWPELATTDKATIRDRRRRWPDAGVGIHPGPGRLLVVDVDIPDRVPAWLWPLLDKGLFRPTTTDPDSKRGHYFYSVGIGDDFGCSASGLGTGWGEVKSYGGAIIVHPTVHPKAEQGHAYNGTGGQAPLLPDTLAEKLTAPADSTARRMLSPRELDTYAARFLSRHTGKREPGSLIPIREAFDPTPGTRHKSMWDQLCWAMREAKAGRFSAGHAADELRRLWTGAIGGESRGGDRDEFVRMLRDAIHAADNDGTTEELWARAHRLPIDEDAFWDSRAVLRDLRQFAQSRLVGPWAALGCALARAVTAIPPSVVLSPTVGSHASLNLFVALVGVSGGGKGAAGRAVAEYLGTTPPPYVTTVGSGEGLAKVYAFRKRDGEQVGLRTAALFDVPEVDSLVALKSRNGATLLPQLRSAWSGEPLGFAYADPTKAMTICGHRYRLCVVLGVQPGRAAPLLDDADGGTPQRFLWLPTNDPDLPDTAPDEPPRYDLRPWATRPPRKPDMNRKFDTGGGGLLDRPVSPAELHTLSIPDAAADAIRTHRRSVVRGDDVDPLDGHKLQCQLKVAAALMYLDGRVDGVNDQDWDLAGEIMAVSAHTRAAVAATLRAKATADNRSRGRAEGIREIEKAEVIDGARPARVAERIVARLQDSDGQARAAMRSNIAARDRDVFADALALLVADGRIRLEEFASHNGESAQRLWLGEP